MGVEGKGGMGGRIMDMKFSGHSMARGSVPSFCAERVPVCCA
jgi:hypothetical protein